MSDSVWFDIRAKCDLCGRFVKDSAVHPIAYRAAEGWNGAVDDGHSSHPACGEDIPVSLAYRPVRIRPEAKP